MPKRDPAYMAEQSGRILDAALACFIQKGIYETSLADICKQAGLSVGAIYVHFASKDEIIRAVADRQLERASHTEIPESRTRFLESLRQEILWYGENGGHARARVAAQLIAEAYSTPSIRALQQHSMQVTRTLVAETLRNLERQQEVLLPLGAERTAEIIISLETGLILSALREQHVPWEAHADAFVAAVARLVDPQAESIHG